MPAKSAQNLTHSQAFVNAVQCVEYWMARQAPSKVAMLIAEDNAQIKLALEQFHEGYTDPTLDSEEAFRARYIVDALHFAKKDKSPLLQIADFCAFFIKRHLMGKEDVDEFFQLLRPHIHDEFDQTKGYAIRVSRNQIRALTDEERMRWETQLRDNG